MDLDIPEGNALDAAIGSGGGHALRPTATSDRDRRLVRGVRSPSVTVERPTRLPFWRYGLLVRAAFIHRERAAVLHNRRNVRRMIVAHLRLLPAVWGLRRWEIAITPLSFEISRGDSDPDLTPFPMYRPLIANPRAVAFCQRRRARPARGA